MVAVVAKAGKPAFYTSGASLDAALEAEVKPTLVKPNLTEINGLLGTSFTPDDLPALQAALAADERFSGIPWVVVTMGGAGAVAFHGEKGYRVVMPNIPAVNATGSGDSTIAGCASHALARGAGDDEVLRCGNTWGKLNAMDPKTGHLVIERWDEVYNAVQDHRAVTNAATRHPRIHGRFAAALSRLRDPTAAPAHSRAPSNSTVDFRAGNRRKEGL